MDCTRALGLKRLGGGDEDAVGLGFSEGEIVVSDADFEGIAEGGEAPDFAGGAFGEAEFEESLPDFCAEGEVGDGGGVAGFQGAEGDWVFHGILRGITPSEWSMF